jgi:hypothetical protein
VPKKPLFASESTQKLAIACVMVFALAVMLAAAAVYSSTWSGHVSRPNLDGAVETGPMFRIQLPKGWRSESTRGFQSKLIKPLAVFKDTEQNDRSIAVGLLPDDVRRTPLEALDIAVADWRTNHKTQYNSNITGVRQVLFGSRLANAHTFQALTDDGFYIVTVLVISDDGRRYHTLIHQRLTTGMDSSDILGDQALLEAMADTLADPLRRDAIVGDIMANELATTEADAQRVIDTLSASGMTLVADRGYGPQPMLQLIPADRKLGLWLLRLRGEMALPTEGEGELTAAAAMKRYITRLTDESQPTIERTTSAEGVNAWTARLPEPANVDKALALHRQISYVKAGDAAFVLESLAVAAQQAAATAGRERIAASLGTALLTSETKADALLKAQQTGELVAQVQRQHASTSPARGWNYELVSMAGEHAGVVATYVGDNLVNDAMPRLIQSLTVFKPANLKVESVTQMSNDGSAYVDVLRRQFTAVNRRMAMADTVTVTLSEGRLRSVQQDRGRTVELWQSRVPGGFLPPGSDLVWSSDALDRLTEQRAVLWQTDHEQGLMPMVVHVEQDAGVTGERMLVSRPLLSIDVDTATIDRNGRTREMTLFIHSTGRHLPMMLEIRRVKKDEFDRYLMGIGERLVVPGE